MSAVSAGPILVVESDPQLGRGIVEQLTADGYRAELASSAAQARLLAGQHAPSLAVLGLMDCPRGALGLLQEIREAGQPHPLWDSTLPAIVLGPQARELDMLRAFETGADDFLPRGARYLELRARLRAILRRCAVGATNQAVIEVGSLKLDARTHAASVHGRALTLRPLEFELLLHLARDPQRVFAKQELLRDVWGFHSSGSTRTLDTHACRLRRKLNLDGSRRWVINVWGVGYRLI